jgi:Cu-processing system permease protein
MISTLHLARLYLLGNLRRQVHLGTLLLAAILFVLPHYVNAFSLGLNAFERVAKDFGISLISFFGVAMAIMLGSTSVPRDVTSRALYPVLARPLSRGAFLNAHFLAVLAVLAASLLFLTVTLGLSLGLMTGRPDSSLFLAGHGAFLQAAVVAAVCLAFSVRCSPALAGTIGGATFLIGNLSGAFIRFFLVEDRDSIISAGLAKGLKALTPNLSLFSLKDPVVHQLSLPAGYTAAVTYHALIWVLLLLSLAQLAFQRQDL